MPNNKSTLNFTLKLEQDSGILLDSLMINLIQSSAKRIEISSQSILFYTTPQN